MNESVKGQIIHEIFHNEENWYTITKVKVLETSTPIEDKEIVVVGTFPSVYPEDVFIFTGYWKDHPRFGRQFHAESYEKDWPKTREGIIKYLSSDLFHGVGKKTAEKIVDHLGENALTVIAENPDSLHEIPGMHPSRANEIYQVIIEHKALEQAMVFLYRFGIGPNLAVRIYQVYLQDTLRILQENPYQLIEDVQGIGFKRADEIGRGVGIGADSPQRLKAAIYHLLSEAAHGSGHVYLPQDVLIEKSIQLLYEINNSYLFETSQVETGLLQLIEEGKVVLDEERCYLPSLYYAEVGFARKVLDLLQTKLESNLSMAEFFQGLGEVEEQLGIEFAPTQREAIEKAMTTPFMILTGGPGTGKTTVIKGICHLFSIIQQISINPEDYRDPEGDPFPILLVAPTGRAAKRMSEATGLPAMTIHRLLGWKGDFFERDGDHPIDGKLLIVDESSMMDMWLANQLFRSIPEGMRVILVGDADQLPSVGPGNVLHDLIRSGQVPVIQLTDIYRQAEGSSIIELAHYIGKGEIPPDLEYPKKDRRFFSCTPSETVELIKRVCQGAIEKGYAVRDIQVLAPMYKGKAGINELNKELQELFNPHSGKKREITYGETTFRVGDKVLQLSNNPDQHVFNGDIGEVMAVITPEESNEKEPMLVVHFDGLEVIYGRSQLHQLTLAYCCSIHKSQGSEFPIVVIPVLLSYYRMLRRKLIYTAVTRGKTYLILCGQREALEKAVKESGEELRYSFLIQRLHQMPD
ncbi:ATP-dependent RecD-like DNA helicase [Microaerobacter geothermalis]|uniref:SF1B family DNA helicase RecD2 n=1 Tax=Microaerobacter geothermalis TaxID=674972 RepID=UPI001F352637|nr:ATP-dependent RecD-like DNA helicase [Microaerobacter geothermalis]MCF6093987.1 ATP-dependent RecD-like DNA helicase [Microaerobacter geothermalis]